MIETDRLILRPHTLEDYEGMTAMFGDPAFFRLSGISPQSREDVWHRLLRYHGHWSAFGWGLFAIIDKTTGQFIGETGLADFHRGLGEPFDPFPEAAWALMPSVQGKGYALEAVTAAHGWFDAHRPQRTVCIIDPINVPSQKVATALGYTAFGDTTYKGHIVTMYERYPKD